MRIFRIPARAGHSKKDSETKKPAPRNRSGFRPLLGAGTVLIISVLLSMHLFPDRVALEVGDISTMEIRAHKTVRYIDTQETNRLRTEAASNVAQQYRNDTKAASEAIEGVSSVFTMLHRARADKQLPTLMLKKDFLHNSLRLELSDNALNFFLTTDNKTLEEIEEHSIRLVKELMGRIIRDDGDDVQKIRAEFQRRMSNLTGSTRYAEFASEIAERYIRANQIRDPDLTEKIRKEKEQSIPPQYRQLMVGELVINNGERVSAEHLDKFTALGLRNPQIEYITVLCIFLFVAVVTGLVIVYLARYQPGIFKSDKLLALLAMIVVFGVLGLKLGGSMLDIRLSGVQFGYFAMFWIATAGMLTAVLLDAQLAVLIVTLLATASGLAMTHELRWAAATLVSGLVAIYAVSDIRHRSDLVRAAAAVCAANLVMVWLIGGISGDDRPQLMTGSTWAIAGGLGSVMLFALGTTVLEKPFGLTTHNRLVELLDTNNPILKRLLMEAPGTYSHSIFTGSIASTAAETIGADSLLVRVAAYYHDIGKIRRPQFFVENQHVENVHDRLNPSLSAIVIRSHIKDGLELAKEYRLPPMICELINQHHGTSLVRFFYSMAASNTTGSSSALEQQFRYEGKKPQSKEAALLMLADAVEAASRTLARPTPGQIEDMVESLIQEKLSDGQLDECELTFKDISRIRNSFVRTLTSMLHARIEYPELHTAEGKKSVGNGNNGKEQSAATNGRESTDTDESKIAAS